MRRVAERAERRSMSSKRAERGMRDWNKSGTEGKIGRTSSVVRVGMDIVSEEYAVSGSKAVRKSARWVGRRRIGRIRVVDLWTVCRDVELNPGPLSEGSRSRKKQKSR